MHNPEGIGLTGLQTALPFTPDSLAAARLGRERENLWSGEAVLHEVHPPDRWSVTVPLAA